MRVRDRMHDDAGPQGTTAAAAGAGQLTRMRDDAQGFLAAGDDAINKALSSQNSEAFLAATRQEGGQ